MTALIDRLAAHEAHELTYDETVALFQELLDTGACWDMDPELRYDALTWAFIDTGRIHFPGDCFDDSCSFHSEAAA